MELQQLRVFLAIEEAGTMSGAAERLAVTQPAISFAIRALEDEIGEPLFARSRKGLTITDRGVALLPTARTMLELAEDITRTKLRSPDAGTLRIIGRQGFMQYVFPLLLKRLSEEMPNLKLEYAGSADHEQVTEALRTGKADIAFGADPGIKSISAVVFHHDPVRLAVAAKHKLSKRTPTLEEIGKLAFCLPSRQDRLRGAIDRFLRKLPGDPRVLLETNDYTIMRNLIAQGECAGFVYGHMFLMEPARPAVVALEIESLTIKRDLTLLYRTDFLQPHVAKARDVLLAAARDVLRRAT